MNPSVPFDDDTVAKIASIMSLADADLVAALRADLDELAAHYRAVIAVLPCDLPGAPFNMSLTKRGDWLEANVIKPCERLLDALTDEQRPMFSTWPYPLTVPQFRDNGALRGELSAMRELAIGVSGSLRAQQSEDAGHSQELRAEIFASIARLVRKHSPNLTPNRGVYDSELRRRVGAYVDVFGMIYSSVTGMQDNLDRMIRTEINHPSQ